MLLQPPSLPATYDLGPGFWIALGAVTAIAIAAVWRFGQRGAQAVGLIGLAVTMGVAAVIVS